VAKRDLLILVELFPSPGTDLAAGAVDVQMLFRGHETFGLKADIIHVVVPTRMLAKRSKENLAGAPGASRLVSQELLEEGFHFP
jgi:hypothetical protein